MISNSPSLKVGGSWNFSLGMGIEVDVDYLLYGTCESVPPAANRYRP